MMTSNKSIAVSITYNLNQMEIGRLEEQLEMLQTVGFTLSVDEK
jgi:hypothetical protein